MYIFLILLSFFMPLAFLILGIVLKRHYPKEINSLAGYRTNRSKKSIEAWNEANRYSTELLIKFSAIILILILIMVILVGKSCDRMSVIVIVSMLLSLVSIGLIVIFTEKRLKNMFGE